LNSYVPFLAFVNCLALMAPCGLVHVLFWNYLGSAIAHVGFTSALVAWHDGVEIDSMGGIMHDRNSSPRLEEGSYIENEKRRLERRTPYLSPYWVSEVVQAGTLQAMVSLKKRGEEYLVGVLSDPSGHVT